MIDSRKLLSFMTTAILIGSLCASPVANQTVQAAAGKVSKVSVSNLPTKNLTLKKKKKFTLKVKVKTTGSASKAVSFKSSNKKIVTVSSKGKLKAKKNGKAKITITSKANKKKKVTIKVTVGTPVSGIKLSDTKLTLAKKQKKQLTATVSPANASNKAIVWKSSNPKVATVSNGAVTALTAGTTTITALAADGSGKKATTQITVTNNNAVAVTGITLDATKKTVSVGETTKLTAAVTPANATEKTLKWTSSNPALVTVDNAGNLKAIKPGTATITAEATDGSGKKASCVITILNPVTVTSSKIMGCYTVRFSLSEPYQLKKSDVSIKAKHSAEGNYKANLNIAHLLTPDNQNYYAVLSSRIDLGGYAQVSIRGLRGNPTMTFELIHKASDTSYTDFSSFQAKINQTFSETVYLYGSIGYTKVDSITGLPDGVTYQTFASSNSTSYISLTGIIDKTGEYSISIQYTDEFGNKYKKDITLTAYDPNGISAYISTKQLNQQVIPEVYVLGQWNDSTNLTIIGESYGLTVEKNDSSKCFDLKGQFSETKPGIYPMTFRVESVIDGKLRYYEFTSIYEVHKYFHLTGTIKDLSNQPVRNAEIILIQTDSNISYSGARSSTYSVNSDGTYDIARAEGEYYLMISTPLTKIYSDPSFKFTKDVTRDFTANLYTVTLTPPDNAAPHWLPTIWLSEDGCTTKTQTDNTTTIEVQPGQHTYTAYSPVNNYFNSTQYSFSGNFNANTKSVKYTVTEDVKLIENPMVLDKTQEQSLKFNTCVLHPFTPTEDGEYYFYSVVGPTSKYSGSFAGYIYDSNGKTIDRKSSNYAYTHGTAWNFAIKATLKKGVTYYLGTSTYEAYTYSDIYWDDVEHTAKYSIPVVISKKQPKNYYNK